MWRLLKFLMTGVWEVHKHEWEIIESRNIKVYSHSWTGASYSSNLVRHTLQCKSCGNIKVEDI